MIGVVEGGWEMEEETRNDGNDAWLLKNLLVNKISFYDVFL